VHSRIRADLSEINELMDKYSDLPMNFADASLAGARIARAP
jgi:hypothetical protein